MLTIKLVPTSIYGFPSTRWSASFIPYPIRTLSKVAKVLHYGSNLGLVKGVRSVGALGCESYGADQAVCWTLSKIEWAYLAMTSDYLCHTANLYR